MAKSTPETLAADIQKILDKYAEDTQNLTKEVVQKIGNKGKQALQSASGAFGGTGKYASGWTSRVEESRTGARATLHNAKVPGLPHLLEHGHANRNGGRTSGKIHIKPVEDELIKAFEQELKQEL